MAPRKNQSSKSAAAKKAPPVVPDSDHIVFTNDRSNNKPKRAVEEETQPPRPDARKIIGGASWTGKLPVNLLSEHCQRQKWNKPDYSMRQMPADDGGGYRSSVTLSATNPKTRDMTKLPPFRLPDSHVHLSTQETALEARHFAAAYALFRVSSMKNIHMMLPPQYRDLWKSEFAHLKIEDEKEGRGWKYDADPFAAEVKRKEIHVAMEKREAEKARAAAAAAKATSLGLRFPSGSSNTSKLWERTPKLDMGTRIRADIEDVIRESAIWNPFGVRLAESQCANIITDLAGLGFRRSHVEEATRYCKDREETLDWLLIHVPEDDLPRWTFPSSYTAGVSLASGDLAKEAQLKKLSQAGYSSDLSIKALQDSNGDERLAAQMLQNNLVPPSPGDLVECTDADPDETWYEELMSLEAVFDGRYSSSGEYSCTVVGQCDSIPSITFHFLKPPFGYPSSASPILAIQAERIPSYIRLSATKQAVLYARQQLLGGPMIFNMIEWLESHLPGIMNNPGLLVDLRPKMKLDLSQGKRYTLQASQGRSSKAKPRRNAALDQELYSTRKARHSTSAQQKMLKARQGLPAWDMQNAIIQAVSSFQCVIISGETGSGKSTQSVQFILDDLITKLEGSSANILCTQPRRISALSLSERVSSERCSTEGDEVGYVIRGDARLSPETRITFMTTGVLLRRLQSSEGLVQALADISHIFVDEVHERSLDTDFLLALLRDAMKIRRDLKVILMSATLDADIFTNYFGGTRSVGRVHIEGRTYPVEDFYLDDVVKMTRHGAKDINDFDEDSTGEAIRGLGMAINYDLIADLVQCIDAELDTKDGGILIFLPGTLEIDRCLAALRRVPNVHGLPLHASLMPAEQRKVFPPAPPGMRKVVASTNVAETSVTIADIIAVIDTGRVKETNYDATDNIVRLQEVWASQAACKQRRGRAGRVRAGTCYKLFTRNIETNMAPRTEPEIRRVPLEQLCLSVKSTGSDRDVAEFLRQTLTPPESGAVSNALKLLDRMGALEDGKLTGLGISLSMIPADLRCAKLLVYGTIFDCVESCLTIAAILTLRSPFISPRDKREEAKEARSRFSAGHGDLLTDLAAYEEWSQESEISNYRGLTEWCSSNFLSHQTLRDIASTRSQLRGSLIDAALLPPSWTGARKNAANDKNSTNDPIVLRALIAGALNPQIAKIEFPDKKYVASVSGAKELDPEAKTIKYFNQENGRVFVHPSSVLFDAQTYSNSAAYVSYFTKMATSKTFIRDLTPFNPYALLLFGGPLEVDTTGNGLMVDGWLQLRGWARIGVLISRLRILLDNTLRQKIENPASSIDQRGVLGIVRRLLEFNGQDR